jgi:hypothetical protein
MIFLLICPRRRIHPIKCWILKLLHKILHQVEKTLSMLWSRLAWFTAISMPLQAYELIARHVGLSIAICTCCINQVQFSVVPLSEKSKCNWKHSVMVISWSSRRHVPVPSTIDSCGIYTQVYEIFRNPSMLGLTQQNNILKYTPPSFSWHLSLPYTQIFSYPSLP